MAVGCSPQANQFSSQFGGGGGGAALPVVGGSGAFYNTVAEAIAGEVETVVADVTTGGTAPARIVGTGALSVVDDFYKDWYVVMTDAFPNDGLVCRYARVVSYVGATKTFTLDQPWDFGVGKAYEIVEPIRIALTRDVDENVSFTKSAEFDLAGHRLRGTVDQTSGSFFWIRGGGWITDGVQKTNLGVLRLDEMSVSRRSGQIYAVLMTAGNNYGRTILNDCRFFGVVAGRRGRAGWEVTGCRNAGIPEGSPPNRNIPYRFFESVPGVAIVVQQADWQANGEWAGSVFYSENSLTGAGAFVSGIMNIQVPKSTAESATPETEAASQPVRAYIYCSIGGATLTQSFATRSMISVSASGTIRGSASALPDRQGRYYPVGMCLFVDFTGTFNVSGSSLRSTFAVSAGDAAEILFTGTSDMTGSVTLSGSTDTANSYEVADRVSVFSQIVAKVRIAGTVLNSAPCRVTGGYVVSKYSVEATQDSPAASVTLSGAMFVELSDEFRALNLPASIPAGFISAGTYTFSGLLRLTGIAPNQGFSFGIINIISQITGGTWTWSGAVAIYYESTTGISPLFNANISAPLTVSGSLQIFGMGSNVGGSFRLFSGQVNMSGTITVRDIKTSVTEPFLASGAGTTLTVSNTVLFENCQFDSAFSLATANAGATFSGPTSVTLENCIFKSSLTDAGGAGTITWTASTWRFRNCHVDAVFTFSGTRFATVEGFETFFNGNTAGKSINASGTRPTTYRLWSCYSRASVFDLKPEVVRDSVEFPAAAALTRGNLVRINATPNIAALGASDVIDGVLLENAGIGATAVAVRDGEVFVDTSGVAAGDYLRADAAGTPTQAIASALGALVLGQTVGRALEATGGTNAGESYSSVRIR